MVCTRPSTHTTLLHTAGLITGCVAVYPSVPVDAVWGRGSFLTYWAGGLSVLFYALSLLTDLGLRRFHRRGKAPLLISSNGDALVSDVLIQLNVVQVPSTHRLCKWIRLRDSCFFTFAPLAWLIGIMYMTLDFPLSVGHYKLSDWIYTLFQHIFPVFIYGSVGSQVYHGLRAGSRDLVRTPAVLLVFWTSNLIGGWVSNGWWPYPLQYLVPVWAMIPAMLAVVIASIYLSSYQALFVWPLLWDLRGAANVHDAMDMANSIGFYPSPPSCLCCQTCCDRSMSSRPIAGTSGLG